MTRRFPEVAAMQTDALSTLTLVSFYMVAEVAWLPLVLETPEGMGLHQEALEGVGGL